MVKKALIDPILECGVANIKNAPDLEDKGIKLNNVDTITRFFHAGGAK
jgi:hypothetical protein